MKNYRNDIDGLRAVAVIPVIFFHAGFNYFSGGFVGVDIFFVISGFLITSILLSEFNQNRFSLIDFYERRVRRILPVLFTMVVTTLPFAYFLMPPQDLKSFGLSVSAVSFFGSNILFWKESGYFDTASALKPLLHTWSLSVEGQYYLLFPVLLLFVKKYFPDHILFIIFILSAVSFLLMLWGAFYKPSAAFFLLPTRWWELGIGSLAAIYNQNRNIKFFNVPIVMEITSLIGFLSIIYSIFIFDKNTAFPNIYALAPTVGAVLVILFSTPKTLIGRMLSIRPLVGVGLLSYSAYLWHQPIFAFMHHKSMIAPSQLEIWISIVITFLLSFLSWKFIELPFKRRTFLNQKSIFILGFFSAFILFLAGGFLISKSEVFQFNRLYMLTEKYGDLANSERTECHALTTNYIPPENSCILGGKKITYALLGDSHADSLSKTISKSLAVRGLGLRQLTYTGCPPAIGLYRTDEGEDHQCDKYNHAVFDFLKNNKDINHVIIVARWSLYSSEKEFDNGEGGHDLKTLPVDIIKDGKKFKSKSNERSAKVIERYSESIRLFLSLGKKVTLIYPIPEVGWEVPKVAARDFSNQVILGKLNISTNYDVYLKRNKDVVIGFNLLSHPNLTKIRPDLTFCNKEVVGRCVAAYLDKIYYRDGDHLSNIGAQMLIDDIMKQAEK